MKHLSIGTSPDFVNNSGLKIKHDGSGDILATVGFPEESAEGLIADVGGIRVIIFIRISI